MPLGIVNDADFEAEIQKSRVINIEHGRGKNPNVPDSLRRIIGENVVEEGRNGTKAMTRALGVSDSSLSAYTHGARSCATYNDRPDLSHINRAKEKIVKKARSRLIASLNGITPEKLAEEKPRDLAAIAKDMSSIVRDFEPRNDDNVAPKALIIFAPQMTREEKFEVIDVTE